MSRELRHNEDERAGEMRLVRGGGGLFRPSSDSAPLRPTPPDDEAFAAEVVSGTRVECRAALDAALEDEAAAAEVVAAAALDEEAIEKGRSATADDGWVVEEDDEGFLYGSDPGHPLSGMGPRILRGEA